MCLDGDRVSGSASEFAVVGSIAEGVVVGVTVVVSAAVEVFGVTNGLLSLPSILSLSPAPNSLFHGIFPRITLEAAVVVVVVVEVVEIDGSLFVVKNGSIVGSNSGASAEVM